MKHFATAELIDQISGICPILRTNQGRIVLRAVNGIALLRLTERAESIL